MSLECSLDVTVGAGSVSFSFSVRNTGDDAVDLRFSDGCKADFVVRQDGRERWRFSDGRMFIQVLSSETLESGDEVTYECTWDGYSDGSYTAEAELQATNHECTATRSFSV